MRINNEKGYSLVEVLIGLVLSAVMVLGLSKSTTQSLQTRTMGVRDAVAAELAIERMEELCALDPSTLSAADSESEEIIEGYATYNRVVTITELADGSKEVNVFVQSDNEKLGGSATLTTTLIAWDHAL